MPDTNVAGHMPDTNTLGSSVEDDAAWPQVGAFVLLSGGLTMVFLAAGTIAGSPVLAMPALAAPAVVAVGLGLQRRLDWREQVGTRPRRDVSLLAAVFGPFLVVLAMVLAGHPRRFELDAAALVPVALAVLGELGWWGYLYPLVRNQLQPLPASVLIGLIWAAWHALLAWAGNNPLEGATPMSMIAWSLSLAFLSAAILEFRPRSILPIALLHLGLDAAITALAFAPARAGTLDPLRTGAGLILIAAITAMILARNEAVVRARHAQYGR